LLTPLLEPAPAELANCVVCAWVIPAEAGRLRPPGAWGFAATARRGSVVGV
jgi:hypothetical protein